MRNNLDRLGLETKAVDPKQDSVEPLVGSAVGENPSALLSFVAPTEFVELPSKGKFYPVGHPLKNKTSIEIKQMTAKEEDILTSKSLAKKGVTLDRLLSSIIVDKTINPEDMVSGDRQAILLAARISGYGADYETSVQCPSCEKKQKHVFDLLEKLPKEESEEEEETVPYTLTEQGTVIVVLPQTKWNVELQAMRGKEEKILSSLLESKKNKQNDTFLVDQLKIMVVSIKGVRDRAVLSEAISYMPAKDSRYLRKIYNEILPSIDLTHTFSCNDCEFEAQMEVPLNADFFWVK